MNLSVLGLTAALVLLAAQEAVEPDEGAAPEPPVTEGEEPSDSSPDAPEDEPESEQPPEEDEDWEDEGLPPLEAFDEADIEEETLPSVEDLAFPELEGDFDGDGEPDRARARESDTGVQIALDLSETGETYVEPLGTHSLSSVEWRVVGPEELLTICDNPVDCPTTNGIEDVRDVIFVTLDESDSFILHWNGGALETYFVDF